MRVPRLGLRAPLLGLSGSKVLPTSQGPWPMFDSGALLEISCTPWALLPALCSLALYHTFVGPQASGPLEPGLLLCLVANFLRSQYENSRARNGWGVSFGNQIKRGSRMVSSVAPETQSPYLRSGRSSCRGLSLLHVICVRAGQAGCVAGLADLAAAVASWPFDCRCTQIR